MVDKIIFNYFVDFKKKSVNKKERADMLANYLDKTGMSQRALAEEIGLPHSTVQDWLLLSRLEESEYEALVAKGMTDTDIYRMLRDNKKAKKDFELLLFKQEIKKCIKKFSNLSAHAKKLDKEAKADVKALIQILEEAI